MTKPTIVCLCGSTRFKDQFEEAAQAETLAGRIVLSVGVFKAIKMAENSYRPSTEDEKTKFDELHKRKIDLADEILVLNVGGYIGPSIRSEIEYAVVHGKRIRYLEAE